MKAVIPYKLDLRGGLELRYAIRSLVKYFTPLSAIVLVGQRPSWYKGDFIPFDDIPGRKEFSIYSKLMQVQGKVLYTNDDYYALKPFDENLPNYCNGFMWQKRRPVDRTYRDLWACCPQHYVFYDIHTPMVIDTTKFTWAVDMPIKTYYANQNNLQGTYLADCKISGAVSYDYIKNRIAGRPFFSTHDNAQNREMQRVLNELYPEKSQYE